MIEFSNIMAYILLLPLLAVLVFYIYNLIKIRNNFLCKEDFKGIKNNIILRTVCFCIAWIFIVSGIAEPLWGAKVVQERRRGSAVLFVMDISRSMTVKDVYPSRLTVAKAYAKLLLNELEHTSCGLVLAKGGGVLAVPVTFDKEIIDNGLNFISSQIFSSVGTNLEDSLATAINSFPKQNATSKSIILFTDGDETIGNIKKTSRMLKKEDITLIIVGIGTTTGDNISVFGKDGVPKLVNTKLNENLLKDLISELENKGLYVRYDSQGSMNRIINVIDLKDKNIETLEYVQKPAEHSTEMVFLAIVFICFGFIFGGLKWKNK